MLTTSRTRQIRRPEAVTVRSVPWAQVAPLLALAMTPIVVTVARGKTPSPIAVSAWALVAGATLAFAFDEPARAVLDAAAVSPARRMLRRLTLLVLAVLATGVLVVMLAGARDISALDHLDARAAELGSVTGLSLAAAATAHRGGPARVSLAEVAFGPLAMLVVSSLATRFVWLPVVSESELARRWWIVAAAGWGVAAWKSRDPYRRSLP